VQGTVDFICGGGTVYFNRCDIVVRARGGKGDVICAPSTETGRPYGYVFNRCRILGAEEQDNRFLLARAHKFDQQEYPKKEEPVNMRMAADIASAFHSGHGTEDYDATES
jgi:pectin methylesterase-like acyl-CoA thioesterase